jgi:hypothetical protein
MFKKLTTIVLLVTGVLALAYASYVVMDAYQARQHRTFEPARMQPPVVSRPIDGEAIGKIQIPRLGVALVRITRPEPPPTIRQDVARPASDFTTYVEGELVSVSIPSNWRKLPGSNAVAFAPEGAYGNVGVRSVFTHGIGMGLARNDKRDLRTATDDVIAAGVFHNLRQSQTSDYTSGTIGNRRGLHLVLSNVSEATGEPAHRDVHDAVVERRHDLLRVYRRPARHVP